VKPVNVRCAQPCGTLLGVATWDPEARAPRLEHYDRRRRQDGSEQTYRTVHNGVLKPEDAGRDLLVRCERHGRGVLVVMEVMQAMQTRRGTVYVSCGLAATNGTPSDFAQGGPVPPGAVPPGLEWPPSP
jgi:hypothetical protein